MKNRERITNVNKTKKNWAKPKVYKLRVNETLSGIKGNGEHKPAHRPKAS